MDWNRWSQSRDPLQPSLLIFLPPFVIKDWSISMCPWKNDFTFFSLHRGFSTKLLQYIIPPACNFILIELVAFSHIDMAQNSIKKRKSQSTLCLWMDLSSFPYWTIKIQNPIANLSNLLLLLVCVQLHAISYLRTSSVALQ